MKHPKVLVFGIHTVRTKHHGTKQLTLEGCDYRLHQDHNWNGLAVIKSATGITCTYIKKTEAKTLVKVFQAGLVVEQLVVLKPKAGVKTIEYQRPIQKCNATFYV